MRLTRPLLLLVLVWGALLGIAGPASAHVDAPRVVRVGTEGTYPPFTYRDPDTNELTGFDIEVMRAVGEEAGWDVQFVEAPFDSLFPALDSGRIDVIANQVTINAEREARYLFSTPYTYSHGVIVTAKDNDDITTLADLEGRTTAQTASSNWAQVARDAGADVKYVQDFGPGVELLVQGRVDAIVNDNIAVLDYLATSGNDQVKIAGDAGDETLEQALTFRKTDPDLRDEADEALAALTKDGTLAKISEKYFGADVTVKGGSQDVDVKGSDSRTRWEVLADTAPKMLRGLVQGTIPLTIASFLVGLALAVLAALARLSSIRPLDWVARTYISIIRGTPLLVQLFLVFYGLGQVGIKLDPYVAAILALSLNVGGYAAEVVRASILSVPRGQYEAATVIGMEYWQSMRRIVLPQAARIAVPPLSNTLLSLIKDTSLVSLILVPELFHEANIAAALSTEYLPLYALAALFYWVVCYLVTLGQAPLERRLSRYVA
ncbi:MULTISPECIES: ABC transporter substrate-binding protein/permease [unclassified Nocardioides]|uniref:ABC transporter substrate-binding protein/permease n=1 Tax=unclassified Nocardioides TaxID=2615069 RepID=UPI0009F0C1E3|nr:MULTISPECIES: ABC transporter substrate-binding protein/permease [unclassified Nocardioides]GAW48327.1 ABC transporter substrate-binding protein [Nocardioides sp. PD653-B2]GAW53252.1 ABC transporter substrate-binding protein [Nocardioides sp. PD653]